MEKTFNTALENLINNTSVIGCIVSDKQGLCLGTKGTATPSSSGLLTAVAEFAQRLNPNETGPVVVLENEAEQCIIQANDKIVMSIYKNVTA